MGKSKRFNAYDEPQANRRKVVQSYGAQRQRLSINSSFRGMPLEPPIVNAESFITGTGTGTFASASLSADQTTNIAATNHVEFDTLDEDGGIVLQTGVGQADGIFELGGARKYYLSASLRPEFSGVTGQLVVAWYDITNAAEIGRRAIYESQTNTSNNANQPSAEVTITPAANITVELRIISVTALTALANEYCVANLFEIALGGVGGTGGGGTTGVTFPITPDINDHGNVGTVTEDLDLSATTGHVHKITLTGNPTLTFSNPPSSGTQMEFEIEFVQDATGGRTVTFPASVVETVVISSTASSTTIVTFRTNDGGTTYHGIPALRGSISLGGGSTFASVALDNLISPILNTDINWNTFDITNMDRLQFAISSGAVAASSTPTIYLNATGDMTSNVATGDSFIKTINNVEEYKMTASALEMNANQITESGAILPNADATFDVGSALLSWDTLHIGIINIGDTNSAPTVSSLNSIRSTATAMAFNLDNTTHSYQFYFNGTSFYQFTDDNFTATANLILGDGVSGGVIQLNDTSANPASNGFIQRNGTDILAFSGGSLVNFSTIATFPTSDSNSIVEGNVDPTKELRLEVDGLTTGTIRVWTVQDANITVAGLNATQIFTSAQSFDDIAKLVMNSNISFPTPNLNIGTSGNFPDSLFIEKIVFPADTGSLTTNQTTLRRIINLSGSTTGFQINVPLNEDFAITENGATSPLAFHIDMSAGIFTLDNPIFTLQLGTAGDQPLQLTKVTGQSADIGCADGIDFLGEVTFEDTINVSTLQNNASAVSVTDDLDFDISSTTDYNLNQSSVGSAGSATALPSQPEGYAIIKINGTERVFPFYKKT